MLPEIDAQEYAAVLDDVAAEVLRSHPGAIPPVDALALAETLGLSVTWDARQQGRGRIARLNVPGAHQPLGSILLRPDPRRERLQWAIAHEIGEWCAIRVFERLAVDPREAAALARESVSNQLASRLLLPRELFAAEARLVDWELPALKAVFCTASHELVARRMLDFAPSVIITVFDHGRRTFRRGNLPFRLPPLVSAETSAWREAHEQSTAATTVDGPWQVRAWPIHEPEWKREIVRAEWSGGCE